MKHRSIIAILLIIASLAGFTPELFHPAHATTSWSSPNGIVVNSTSNDVFSSGLQASNGTLWLAWETNRFRGDSLYDIAYQTFTNGVWSSAHQLTSSSINVTPSIVQLPNGTIFLFWAYKPAASYLIYYERFNPNSWSSPVQVSSTALNDTLPSAAVGQDGTLWLAWTRTNTTCVSPCTDQAKQLYYKTLRSGVWSSETKLSTDSSKQNWAPSVMVGKDSIVRVTWSKGLGSLENYQIYYKTYNGTAWSTERQIVTSANADEHPSIMQDRNGTIWSFWGRKIYISSLSFYYALFGMFSYNDASTWSTPVQLTNTATNVDSLTPNAVQSTYNKSIWLFYTTDANKSDDIYALISTPISPIHDVTITGVSTPSWFQYAGGMPSIGESGIVSFTVTVLNRGDQSEIVTVNLSLSNASSISLGTNQNLATPGGSVNLVFSRNMTRDKLGWYNAFASVAPVPGETIGNQADNNATYIKTVRLVPWGDMDQDGNVNLQDVSVFVYDFGFTPATPSRWCAVCDITDNGVIDLLDVSIAVKNFGIAS
jgi:hypothetical protein